MTLSILPSGLGYENHGALMHGVHGRWQRIAQGDSHWERQEFLTIARVDPESGDEVRIVLSWDGQHSATQPHSFSVTTKSRGRAPHPRDEYTPGVHKLFPELAHLAKYSMFTDTGPLYYVENTVFHAGNLDCHGYAPGEASRWESGVYFGDDPLMHVLEPKFAQWLLLNRGLFSVLEVVEVAHVSRDGVALNLGPKYSVSGYDVPWHLCPFDSRAEATEFLAALRTKSVTIGSRPIRFSEGKLRDLEAARATACWPDATAQELSGTREELTARLVARLPALMETFYNDLEAAGFYRAPSQDKTVWKPAAE